MSGQKETANKFELKENIKNNGHMKTSLLPESLVRKLHGYYNYFGVSGIPTGLHAVKKLAMEQLHKWFNRRSGWRSFT
jgi:hypothetical protein